jgi:hypothetical protein
MRDQTGHYRIAVASGESQNAVICLIFETHPTLPDSVLTDLATWRTEIQIRTPAQQRLALHRVGDSLIL